jgi:hypothetical protein
VILATGPAVLSTDHLRWIVVGVALVAPWFALAYMDRLLRRTR